MKEGAQVLSYPYLSFVIGFVLLFHSRGAGALGDLPSPQTVRANAVEVVVKTVEPAAARGRLVSLSLSQGLVLMSDGQDHRIPTSDLVRISVVLPGAGGGLSARAVASAYAPEHTGGQAASGTRTTTGAPLPADDDTILTLIGDDLLRGRLGDGGNDNLILETADLGRMSIPLEAVRTLDTSRSRLPTFQDAVRWLDQIPVATDDRILLTNGDVVRGYVTMINGRHVTIDNGAMEVQVPLRLVVAARFASSGKAAPNPPYAVAILADGARITLTDVDWSGGVVRATWRHGAEVQIRADKVARMDIVGGRWEWLAAHRTISRENTPMLGLHWEPAINRNVLGGPIMVTGETFENGIGVHSRSSLTYDLKGAYKEFVTSFGIDDNSGQLADVTVLILVDGRRRFAETNVRRGKLFGPVRIDLVGAKRIELIVDFGENGGLQDRFNWVEPALILTRLQ